MSLLARSSKDSCDDKVIPKVLLITKGKKKQFMVANISHTLTDIDIFLRINQRSKHQCDRYFNYAPRGVK